MVSFIPCWYLALHLTHISSLLVIFPMICSLIMTTNESTLPSEDNPYDRLQQVSSDGIYTLITEHPSTPDTATTTSQPPPFPPTNRRLPQRDAFGYSSVNKPKKKDQSNRSKTFSGQKTPPAVHTTNNIHAQSSAPSPSLSLTKSEVFNENYSDVNISLKELVDKYYERFPVLIRVTQGVCGGDERVTLSSLDCFKVHFLKHVDVVNITSSNGVSYNVPQSSVLEFGLIFKPEEGTEGMKFNKVSDILAAEPCPKLLCVEEDWSDEKVSLVASEVLSVVKAKKKLMGKPKLVVYSFKTQTEKVIPKHCTAKFTTKPHSVRLHIPEIIEHVHDALPCDAYIFVNDTCKPESELPEVLLANAVRINGKGKESSLVAAPATPGSAATGQDASSSSCVEIPLDLKGVTLSVISTSSVNETEILYDDTRRVIEKFNPSMLRSPHQENESSNIQQVLYSSLRRGYETIGMNIDVPLTLKQNPVSSVQGNHRSRTPSPPPPPTPPPVPSRAAGTADSLLLTPTAKQGESFNYPAAKETIISRGSAASSLNSSPMKPLQRPPASEDASPSSTSFTPINPRPPMPLPSFELVGDSRDGEMVDNSDKEDSFVIDGLNKSSSEASWHNENICAKVNEVQALCKTLESRVSAVESTRANCSELMKLQLTVNSMNLRLEGIEKMLQSLGADHATTVNGFCIPSLPSPSSPSSTDQNIQYLKSLDCSKVHQLLNAMDLGQYADKFHQEKVSGEILTELDDKVLSEELGVTSKLHRLRLLKIMTGAHSAEPLLV